MSIQPEQPVKVLALAGSLREASFNRRLVRLAAELAPEGIELVEYRDLRDVEPFDEDVEGNGATPGADAFRAAIDAADAVLIVTPEYNASIPGQLKNALDWSSRAHQAPHGDLQRSVMYGKPVAAASVSTGQFGAVWARDELIKSLRTQGARVVTEPSVAVPNAATAFDQDEALASPDLQEKLLQLVTNLGTTAAAVRTARARVAAASS